MGWGGAWGRKELKPTGNTRKCLKFANIYGVSTAVCPRRFAEDGVSRTMWPSCAGGFVQGSLPKTDRKNTSKNTSGGSFLRPRDAPASGHRFERPWTPGQFKNLNLLTFSSWPHQDPNLLSRSSWPEQNPSLLTLSSWPDEPTDLQSWPRQNVNLLA